MAIFSGRMIANAVVLMILYVLFKFLKNCGVVGSWLWLARLVPSILNITMQTATIVTIETMAKQCAAVAWVRGAFYHTSSPADAALVSAEGSMRTPAEVSAGEAKESDNCCGVGCGSAG